MTEEWASLEGLASWRGESKATVRRKLPGLYAIGFPQPVMGKWYLPACREWATGATQLNTAQADDPLLEALDG